MSYLACRVRAFSHRTCWMRVHFDKTRVHNSCGSEKTNQDVFKLVSFCFCWVWMKCIWQSATEAIKPACFQFKREASVKIEYGCIFFSLYKHLHTLKVKKGQRSTGLSEGAQDVVKSCWGNRWVSWKVQTHKSRTWRQAPEWWDQSTLDVKIKDLSLLFLC